MAISSSDDSSNRTFLSSNKEMVISRLLGPKWTLSFLQLLKLEKAKCPLLAQDPRFDHFFIRSSGCKVRAIVRGRKCQHLGSWAKHEKNKDTLFSQTFKIEERKVSLDFLFLAQEPRYDHFFFRSSGCKVRVIVRGRIANISAPGPKIKKSKDTLLSQTLKDEEKKVSLVF